MANTKNELAQSRERFLTAEPSESGGVRPAILASWRRSRDMHVAADKVELPYQPDPEIDTGLTRSAETVLHRLREQLDGQPVSIILTDASGLVLSRRTGDSDLERRLDRVHLAPGFSYNEQFVGTNGIGTALESGAATHVFGHEHYAEYLEDLACAGVPIHHPITGRTVGAVDLTCWRKDAEMLLMTLAKTTGQQIQQAMLADAELHELELFQAYRRTCRRMSGIVFALTSDAVLLNDHARSVLDPNDQAALLAQASHAAEELQPGPRWSDGLLLPTGTPAQLYYNQVTVGTDIAGVVVHVKLGEPDKAPAHTRDSVSQVLLPGLVGHAPLWLRACQEVERAFRAGDWVALEGEPGTGKLALLRSVQVRRHPAPRFSVFDAGSADDRFLDNVGEALRGKADSIVIRHVDRLEPTTARALAADLQAARAQRQVWVAVTLANPPAPAHIDQLLRHFPRTIEVPPLRMHLDDLPQLVSHFLARLGKAGSIACSPEALRLLTRASWPGNTEQLRRVLKGVTQHRRSGSIQATDLPPEVQTVSRRRLSALESLERDAIVNALADAGGNKVQAARALGMSRATIYRKIHEYGIVVSPASSR